MNKFVPKPASLKRFNITAQLSDIKNTHKVLVEKETKMKATPGINKSVWEDPEMLRDLDKKIAMGVPGEAQDVANAVLFAASDMAKYMTGTTIVVDGGMLIYPDFRHGG